jgi:hypothetical protein
MEAANTSETLVNFYQTTLRDIAVIFIPPWEPEILPTNMTLPIKNRTWERSDNTVEINPYRIVHHRRDWRKRIVILYFCVFLWISYDDVGFELYYKSRDYMIVAWSRIIMQTFVPRQSKFIKSCARWNMPTGRLTSPSHYSFTLWSEYKYRVKYIIT